MGQASHAAGFNCKNAKTKIEKLICADLTLSADDDGLAALFKILNGYGLDIDDPLYVGQRAWLKNIRDVCTTQSCVHTTYQERIGFLKNAILRKYPNSIDKLGDGAQCKLVSPMIAKPGCLIISDCAENADYSYFQALVYKCENQEEANMQNISVFFYKTRQSKPILLKPVRAEIWPGTPFEIKWKDVDKNGFSTLFMVNSCGNQICPGDVYRFDLKSQEMYQFYSGDYDNINYFDGYMINGGREGCCTFYSKAYKVHQIGSRDIVESDKTLLIETKIDSETGDQSCEVFEYVGENDLHRLPAKLPNKKWLKYCPTAAYRK